MSLIKRILRTIASILFPYTRGLQRIKARTSLTELDFDYIAKLARVYSTENGNQMFLFR